MSLRDQRQGEFAKAWLKTRRGILYLCPRFGKIKTSINIMRELDNPKTLIIYPIETIKKSWEEDLIKWGYPSENISYSTTASLWKLATSPEQYGLVIIDECHLLSDANVEELKAILAVNKTVLGLSGTIADKTASILKEQLQLDIVAHYDIETAIREKVITDYQITVVLTTLNNVEKNIQPSKKYPKYKVTEAQRYEYLTNKMEEIKQQFLAKKAIWDSKYFHASEAEKKKLLDKKPDLNNDYGLLPIQRMHIFKKSLAKMEVTGSLLVRTKRHNQRALVFCGTIESANSLGIPVFHSKAKDLEVRDAFCKGEGDFLATVDMFEAGVTVKPINVAIINSFDSNPETLGQRISRLTGFEYDNPSKVAKVYIVCCQGTVEEGWLTKALEFFDSTKITYIKA